MSALHHDFKTRRFWQHFAMVAFTCLGVVLTSVQAVGFLFPTMLPVLIGGWALLVYVGASVALAAKRAWPRPIAENYAQSNTKISIVKGDLLDESHHLVVGICTTFDTSTPIVISERSLQGQMQARLFGNDVKHIDKLIDEQLLSHKPASIIQKEGKTSVYDVGTVLPLKQAGRLLYLLAYCDMDINNNAKASIDGVWKSLQSLWKSVNTTGNGNPVSISAIGGGQSRISHILPAQDAIRLIALSFMFASRDQRVSEELRIVVQKSEFEKLDRLQLQAFLTSLKAS